MHISTANQYDGQRVCLICGEKKIHYNFSIGKFRIEKCLTCTLMRVNPQATPQELVDLKIQHLSSNCNQSEVSASFNEHYFNLLESYTGILTKGRLLHIGPVCDDVKKFTINKGLRVTEVATMSEIEILLAEKEIFDYVIFVNTLQRIRNPRSFLRNIHALLKQDGIVMAILPSLDSPIARLMKSRWAYFSFENFWYFSRNTLIRLFYNENFGELKFNAIKELVSIDYLYRNLSRYSKQPFSVLIQCANFLPRFFRKHQFYLATSKVVLFARAQPVRSTKKLSIIMPVFNEENFIQKTLESVLAKKIDGIEIELIIIESNSKDGTSEIVKQYEGRERVTIIWQDSPQGKGHAVRAGLSRVSGDYILIQDADAEYDIEDYDMLIEPLVTGQVAFVLGARHGGVAWKIRQFEDQKFTGHLLNFGHWIFTTLVNIVYGLKLKDPFTMYKVFRTDCLKGIKLESNRFDFDYELLIKLVRNGYRPIEIPVNYRSRSFKEGKKIKLFRDPLTWLVAIIKYKFQKI